MKRILTALLALMLLVGMMPPVEVRATEMITGETVFTENTETAVSPETTEALAEETIETRLSDGFAALKAGEVDTVITAGMGGGLVIKIMTDYPEITDSIKCFILQPQSEIHKVREFLYRNDFSAGTIT